MKEKTIKNLVVSVIASIFFFIINMTLSLIVKWNVHIDTLFIVSIALFCIIWIVQEIADLKKNLKIIGFKLDKIISDQRKIMLK